MVERYKTRLNDKTPYLLHVDLRLETLEVSFDEDHSQHVDE